MKPEEIIGMKVKDAVEFLKKEGFRMRVTKRNGMNLIGTADFDANRINVETDNDVIIKIFGGG